MNGADTTDAVKVAIERIKARFHPHYGIDGASDSKQLASDCQTLIAALDQAGALVAAPVVDHGITTSTVVDRAKGFYDTQAPLSTIQRLGQEFDAGEVLARRVAETMDEDGGCWSACSGCQEGVDGYVSTRDYPYSPIFKCQPGSGCRECGGIGVTWMDGAFLAGYGDALSDPPQSRGQAFDGAPLAYEDSKLPAHDELQVEIARQKQWAIDEAPKRKLAALSSAKRGEIEG